MKLYVYGVLVPVEAGCGVITDEPLWGDSNTVRLAWSGDCRYSRGVMLDEYDLGAELEESTVIQTAVFGAASTSQTPALTLACHPDLSRVGERVLLPSLSSGREVSVSRLEPGFAPPSGEPLRPLSDRHISRQPVQLVPDCDGGIRIARRGSPTRLEVNGVEVEDEIIVTAAELARGCVLALADVVVLLLHSLPPLTGRRPPVQGLVGDSPAIHRVRTEIERVAPATVPVLIRGETGTGKELVAQAIHSASPRASRPFVPVNLAAIPPSLAAAELFGATKGAYTGSATSRPGYFRQADGGTLFLDEIGEAPPDVQVMLLRALESSEVQAVGATRPDRINVRVIAATDTDLVAAVKDDRFRAPLLHRLSGYEIELPPLRRRRDDIARLFLHFLRDEVQAAGRPELAQQAGSSWLGSDVVARFMRADWPGNVRQLRNAVRQVVVTSLEEPRVVIPAALRQQLETTDDTDTDAEATTVARPASTRKSYRMPSDVNDEELIAALSENRWRIKPTATQLGVSRTSLYELIDRCPKIRRARDISADEIKKVRDQAGGRIDSMVDELGISRAALLMRMKELGIE